MASRPIVVVTGANAGVGFGICQRLLFQLCHSDPSDALPQDFAASLQDSAQTRPKYNVVGKWDGLTIIMACRNKKRAKAARGKLYALLDEYVRRQKEHEEYDGHAEVFRQNVDIQTHYLDLADMSCVFDFCREMVAQYPYISHLIFNAGLVSWSGLHWWGCMKQFMSHPLAAVTSPTYYLQRRGETSVDGLGWIWQCNFFAHYALFRSLQPLLDASPLGSRVIWSSSLEASPAYYDPSDWQLVNNKHSYECSKYQIDIVATYFNQQAALTNRRPTRTRHFISQPGVCATNVTQNLIGPYLEPLKVLIFYFARWFGSRHHTIDPFKAAIAAVHLALVSICFITFASGTASTTPPRPPRADGSLQDLDARPVRFGSETDWWGQERVGLTLVAKWEEHKEEAGRLVEKCDALYETLKRARGRGGGRRG